MSYSLNFCSNWSSLLSFPYGEKRTTVCFFKCENVLFVTLHLPLSIVSLKNRFLYFGFIMLLKYQAVYDATGLHSDGKQWFPSLVHVRRIHHSGFYEGIDSTTCKCKVFQQKNHFFLNPRSKVTFSRFFLVQCTHKRCMFWGIFPRFAYVVAFSEYNIENNSRREYTGTSTISSSVAAFLHVKYKHGSSNPTWCC